MKFYTVTEDLTWWLHATDEKINAALCVDEKSQPKILLGSWDSAVLSVDIYNQRMTSVIAPWGALSVVIKAFLHKWSRFVGTLFLILMFLNQLCKEKKGKKIISFFVYHPRCYPFQTTYLTKVILKTHHLMPSLTCAYCCVDMPGKWGENYSGGQIELCPLVFSKYQGVNVISHHQHHQIRCEWEDILKPSTRTLKCILFISWSEGKRVDFTNERWLYMLKSLVLVEDSELLGIVK